MAQVERMDKATVKTIASALEGAAQLVAEDYGLEVKMEGGRFDPEVGTFSPKMTFSIGGSEEREFAIVARSFGLVPEDYGREFTSRGEKYRLVALKTRSPRYPVIAEAADGKRYKFGEPILKSLAA